MFTEVSPVKWRENVSFAPECVAGIYIILCTRIGESFKIGWTRNINRRLWHATYDAFGANRYYAYALLFRFRDTEAPTNDTTPVYRVATGEELDWITQQLEAQILLDTKDHQDTQMASEWRIGLSVEECIERIEEVAQEIVDWLPEEVQPEMLRAHNFRPPRPHQNHVNNLYNVCTRLLNQWSNVQRDGFRRWKETVQAMRAMRREPVANPQDDHGNPPKSIWQARDYQITTIDYCTHHLQHSCPRMYLELATGAGKSYINYRIFEALNAQHVLIFSPRKNINDQNVLPKYIRLLPPHPHRVVINFSNPVPPQLPKNTTNISYVFVACPQNPLTLAKVKHFLVEHYITNVCAWFDEAHHTVESWLHTQDTTKTFFLYNSEYIQYRLFTSASPDDKIVDMHPRVFGERYCPISVSELIAQGWLCPIVPYIFNAPKNDVDICQYNLRHFELHKSSHGFSFHYTCENASKLFAHHVAMYQNKATTVKPFLLVGEEYQKHQQNRERLKQMRDELDYECYDIKTYEATPNSMGYVCQKFSMGYDFSKIDYLLMCDPKTSAKDVKQCLGRGTRPDKLGPNGTNRDKRLHVMLPVYLDNGDEKHDYQCIRQVLRYLIFDIGITLKEMITEQQRPGGGNGTTRDQPHSLYDGTESIEAMLLDVLKDSSSDTSGWTQHRMARMMQKHDVHDYPSYNQLRTHRPELFLPTDPFLACNKQFCWIDTYKNDTNPYHDKTTCKQRVNELVDTHDLELDEMDTDDVVETLHSHDARIPPMPLERFYGVQMY